MSRTSGMARKLQSARSGLKFSNLTEFRGTLVDALTDFFFGVTTVDRDWRDPSELNSVDNWIYTQDGDYVFSTGLYVDKGQVYIDAESAALPNAGMSNHRNLFTLRDTATWGIAHALTEIVCGDTFNQVVEIAPQIKPQHGLGLRAQEDNKRRAVMFWHDITFGLPESLNLGVWVGNLDGTGFTNRQISLALSLGETYTMTGARRQSNEYIIDVTSHGYIVGDMVNALPGVETDVTNLQRSGNVVTCATAEPHGCVVGSIFRILFSGISSFNGNWTITAAPTTTTLQWSQTAANEGPTTSLGWDYTDRRWGKRCTAVTPTELRFPDTGPDKTFIMDGTHIVQRQFPYWMEMQIAGNVAMGRCWGRHQPVPSWYDPTHSIVAVLDAPAQNFTITQRERTSNVARVEIGENRMVIGERITISGSPDVSYNGTTKMITGLPSFTAVTYDSVGSDEAPTASSGTVARIGTGTAATVISNPAPQGSGRIAFVGAHVGDVDISRCVYGGFYGDTSFNSNITAMGALPVIELETAERLTVQKTQAISQVIETETAAALAKTRTRTVGQVIETEAALAITVVKTLAVGQVIETEIATALTVQKVRTAAQVIELETATALAAQKSRAVTQVIETETALAIGRLKSRVPSQVIELETATALTAQKVRVAAQVIELETATTFGRLKTRTASQVIELESSNPITRLAPAIGQVIELETAAHFTVLKARAIGQVIESEIAAALIPIKTRAIAQVIETETAAAVARTKIRLLGQVIDAEFVRTFTAQKLRVIGQVVELESSLQIVRFIAQVGPPSGVGAGAAVSQGQTHSRHGARPQVSTGRVRVV